MLKKIILFMLVGFLNINTACADTEDDITGLWLNQAGDGQIEISKQGEKFVGTIAGSTDPNSADRKDINNPDLELRDRLLQGMIILGDLTYRGDNKWSGGWIYDPNNGKTYKCKMSLKDKNTLKLRGYIGISVFGRTEEWKRMLTDENS